VEAELFHVDGRTDVTKLVIVFRKFVKVTITTTTTATATTTTTTTNNNNNNNNNNNSMCTY
jgi:hypothetical protein